MNVKKNSFFFREIIKKTSKIVWCDKILNSNNSELHLPLNFVKYSAGHTNTSNKN